MKQEELVMRFVRLNGSIIPAKMSGKTFEVGFFGSEVSRTCRRLREKGKLISRRWALQPKFMEFLIRY